MENKMNINGIEYVLAGDYYIPDLKLPNEERTSRKSYLRNTRIVCVSIKLLQTAYCSRIVSSWVPG